MGEDLQAALREEGGQGSDPSVLWAELIFLSH